MRVLIAGASGLIGSATARSLAADGHDVRRLVRRAPGNTSEVRWQPERNEIDDAILSDVDAVVCLSGAGVGDHRWSQSYRQTILRSRVDTVSTLAQAIARAEHRPSVFLAASAVGYYGDAGSAEIDESAANGRGFLAEVCRD